MVQRYCTSYISANEKIMHFVPLTVAGQHDLPDVKAAENGKEKPANN